MREHDKGWRVTGLHHVAFAHGDGDGDRNGPDGPLRDALHLEGLPEESAPGFVERMFPVGDSFIQTLRADGEGTVQRFVEQRGAGLHHVALEVDAIDTAVADLREQGVRLVDETPRPGGMGTRIAFVHPSAFGGMLVELVQRSVPVEPAPDGPKDSPGGPS